MEVKKGNQVRQAEVQSHRSYFRGRVRAHEAEVTTAPPALVPLPSPSPHCHPRLWRLLYSHSLDLPEQAKCLDLPEQANYPAFPDPNRNAMIAVISQERTKRPWQLDSQVALDNKQDLNCF